MPQRTGDGRSGSGLSERAAQTRAQIMLAAVDVVGRLGLAHATTKEIARAAGYSEATLYKHFRDKDELMLTLLSERIRPFVETIVDLPGLAGTKTVRTHLRRVVAQMLAAFLGAMPTVLALFGEPRLLEQQRQLMMIDGGGPHKANQFLADYLRREQRLGRLDRSAHPASIADTVVGACFQRAFLIAFAGGTDQLDRADDRFVADLVRTTLRGLEPR